MLGSDLLFHRSLRQITGTPWERFGQGMIGGGIAPLCNSFRQGLKEGFAPEKFVQKNRRNGVF
jgi:hypothetical protein